MKVKVEVLIDYDMKGEPFEAVEDQLMWALDHLYNCGLLSGDLRAEVEDFKFTIVEVKE
jgi:hypothetical protein